MAAQSSSYSSSDKASVDRSIWNPATRNPSGAILRPAEDHHVAGHRHHVEASAEIHRGQISGDPLQIRSGAAGEVQQIVVEIDSDDVDAATGELHRYTTHTAAGIEHRAGTE